MVKKIKSRGPDWQRMLLTKEPPVVIDELRRRHDDEATADILLDIIVDVDAWREIKTPANAARALLGLDREGDLLDLYFDLVEEWDLDDFTLDAGLGAIGTVIGLGASASARVPVHGVDRLTDRRRRHGLI